MGGSGDRASSPIRVGLYAVGISGPGSGVWSRFVALAVELSRRTDVEVVVVVSEREWAESLVHEGVHAVAGGPGGRIARSIGARRAQQKFVDEFELDLLQVEAPPVAKRLSVPTLFSLHDLRSFHKPLRRLRGTSEIYERLVLRNDVRRATVTLALSQSTDRDIRKFLSESAAVRVLPAPVARPPETGGVGIPELHGRSFVLALGHLEARKNLATLVRASVLPEWPRGVPLVLAGRNGGSENELRRTVDRLGADVLFLGAVSDPQKWGLLRDAAVVAVPSLVEGFGIVAVEGGLVGTPVLVSDRTSLPEIYGIPAMVIPADSPQRWANAVGELVSGANWASGLIAQQGPVAEGYLPAAVVERLVAIYRELLERRGADDE